MGGHIETAQLKQKAADRTLRGYWQKAVAHDPLLAVPPRTLATV